MTISYTLNDSDSWELLWNGSFSVAIVPSSEARRTPLPEISIPIQAYYPIIAVKISSASNPGHWKFGGYVNQKAVFGIIENNQANNINTSKQKIWLDRVTAVFFPQLTDSYQITFNIPWWLRQVDITVWQYIGPVEDSYEQKFDYIQGTLAAILDRING